MAAQAKRLATNVPGDFFVDSTCIDCEACRWVAPRSFEYDGDDHSRVYHQPESPEELLAAQMALLACPTGSIGMVEKHDLTAARAAFPQRLTENVYYCGYHDEDSFGAASYLITRPSGNWLIDVPRWTGAAVEGLKRLGGISHIFFTHKDDVGDHAKYAAEFGAARIMHRDDARGMLRDVEHLIDGEAPVAWANDLTLIPTPGHTRGSMCLLYRDEVLFTGDHLAYSVKREHLYAFSGACWYDWRVQQESMARLRDYRFDRVLPGHGHPWAGTYDEAAASLERCIAWMAAVRAR